MYNKRETIGTLSKYASLEEVQRELDAAKDKAKKDGYKDLELEIEDDYGCLSIIITGKRPENEVERTRRLAHQRTQEDNEREMYERLKVKYGKAT